jgi:hypothetical protein
MTDRSSRGDYGVVNEDEEIDEISRLSCCMMMGNFVRSKLLSRPSMSTPSATLPRTFPPFENESLSKLIVMRVWLT